MGKLTVYVHSHELSTLDFIDKEGAQHACAQAQNIAFQGLQQLSGLLSNHYLTNGDREALTLVEDYCKANSLEFHIADLGKASFLAKLRFRIKGLSTPMVSYENKILQGIPNLEDLAALTKPATDEKLDQHQKK